MSLHPVIDAVTRRVIARSRLRSTFGRRVALRGFRRAGGASTEPGNMNAALANHWRPVFSRKQIAARSAEPCLQELALALSFGAFLRPLSQASRSTWAIKPARPQDLVGSHLRLANAPIDYLCLGPHSAVNTCRQRPASLIQRPREGVYL